MTDEDFENIVGQVAREFHDEYIAHPDRDDMDTMKIAVDYTMYILERFSKLVEEYESDKGQNNRTHGSCHDGL